jgi:hypothetical protein
MDMKPERVATIAGDAEVNHAIATLVLAFGTDPVARWMYDDPHQYLLHIPRLFHALGTRSFEAGAAQRSGDGFAVALWLPPGVHSDDGPVCTENSNPDVMMVKPAEDRVRTNDSHPLNRTKNRRILVQGPMRSDGVVVSSIGN